MKKGSWSLSRLTIVVVVALFFVPLLLAAVITGLAPGWLPWGTTNHGTLIVPPRAITADDLSPLGEGVAAPPQLLGKWTLVYLGVPPCEDICQQQLHKIRQVRLALGKDARRVQRLYLAGVGAPRRALDSVLEQYPGMGIAELPSRAQTAFSVDEDDSRSSSRIYIVDPMGYVMMYHSPELDGTALLKDVKRLLKASRIG